LFLEGEYIPLEPDLTVDAGIVAFARRHGNHVMLAIVPRLIRALLPEDGGVQVAPDVWRTSRVILPPDLADGIYRNLFTGETVRPMSARRESWVLVGEALASCPVALLMREAPPVHAERAATVEER
jgi:(1->4)-alpha-D-glucan 1-alpha-D-glucosylmutase